MWRPPERIKHRLPDARWPSAEEAARSPLFSPVAIGPVTLAERTWVPAMVPWRASPDGFVTDDVLAWYESFAAGEPGAIVVEATGIRDVPSGPLLRIGDDRFLPGLATLVETVHRASSGRTKLLIQVIDFLAIRRRPDPTRYFGEFLAITPRHREALPGASDAEIRARLAAMPDDELARLLDDREIEALQQGARERVTDVHLPHVASLPETLPALFAAATRRAEQAGFDGVELHFAHAYTMASFLSRLNTRADGYGTTLEGRVRLPLEVLAASQAAAGPGLALGLRFLSDDCLPGGSDVDDACFFAERFARAGAHFLSLSRGGKFEDAQQPAIGAAAYPYTGPSGYECMPTIVSDTRGPFGRNVDPARRIRDTVRAAGFTTPIVAVGGIGTFEQAEDILRTGAADIIGSARQSLADPDWFKKTRLGLGDQVRRCTFTNYCEALDQRHEKVTCQLWDRQGLQRGERRLVAPPWDPGSSTT